MAIGYILLIGAEVGGKGSGLVRVEAREKSRNLIMKDLVSYIKEVGFYTETSMQLLFLRPRWEWPLHQIAQVITW